MVNIKLKISSFNDVDPEILQSLRAKSDYIYAKLTTTKLELELDRKDNRFIKQIKNVKMVLRLKDGGILGLIGKLGCSYNAPYGGEFFIKKAFTEKTLFEEVKGTEIQVMFTTVENPSTIEEMHDFLDTLRQDSNFVYNLEQFSEFMEIFEFYKKISDELNNNYSFEVLGKGELYYFLPADCKDLDSDFEKEIYDINGVLVGYRFNEIQYNSLRNELKDLTRMLIDIHIDSENEEYKKIKRAGIDNIYLSNYLHVKESEIKNLRQFVPVNITQHNKELVISGELKKEEYASENYLYLNIYDMGQKIKVASIDESLKLINQGATGAASKLLEYLIGSEIMPNNNSHSKLLPKKSLKYVEGLNEAQKEAFKKAVDGSPVTLIKGPPGTGKTHVINAIVQYITKELKEKVVVSSQTHIAIDNVLDKLVENYDIVIPNRITNRRNKYSNEEIDKTLYRCWGRKFFEHNNRASNISLRKAVEEQMKQFKGDERFSYSSESNTSDYSVIGATTTTSAIAGKKGLETLNGYDWLIIDEVSKCPITEVLRYLPYVSKIIMVGDDFQLAPLLEFSKEEVKDLPSYNEEMFDKLQSVYEQSVFAKVMEKAIKSKRLALLDTNYRSVDAVLKAYNVFYDGKLKGMRESIRPEKVQFIENGELDFNSKDVFFVEVKFGQEIREGTSRYNPQEIKATAKMIEELIVSTKDAKNVTVAAIFPYAAQISHFQKDNIELINKAKRVFKSFDIDTVDAFQGKECDIVLVDTVVADSSQRNFLNDFRRINVSMSRARDKLIVFGNSIVLKKINMKISGGEERHYFDQIITYIESKGGRFEYSGKEITNGTKRENKFIF